jgi:hypothetical protein
LCGCIVEYRALEAHLADHLAAAEEWRHRCQVLASRPQRAGAGGTAHLVSGEGVEIAAERGDIDGAMRHRLRTVDHGDDAALARFAADLAHRVDRAKHVRHLRETKQLDLRRHRLPQRIEVQLARRRELRNSDARPGALGHQLPGHDVGVVLHAREQDGIAGLSRGSAQE